MFELELERKKIVETGKMVELSICFTHLSFCFIDTTSVPLKVLGKILFCKYIILCIQ